MKRRVVLVCVRCRDPSSRTLASLGSRDNLARLPRRPGSSDSKLKESLLGRTLRMVFAPRTSVPARPRPTVPVRANTTLLALSWQVASEWLLRECHAFRSLPNAVRRHHWRLRLRESKRRSLQELAKRWQFPEEMGISYELVIKRCTKVYEIRGLDRTRETLPRARELEAE